MLVAQQTRDQLTESLATFVRKAVLVRVTQVQTEGTEKVEAKEEVGHLLCHIFERRGARLGMETAFQVHEEDIVKGIYRLAI